MGDVIILDCDTTLDIPVERVLDGAKEYLEGGDVVVLGYDSEGKIHLFTSFANKAEITVLLETCKRRLLDGTF